MRLRELRKKKGLRQYMIAERLGLSNAFASAMELERTQFGSLSTLRGVCRVLGVDLLELLPSWVLSCGGAYLFTPEPSKVRLQHGRDEMRIVLLALLVRNWDRLTEADLQRLLSAVKTIHRRWHAADARQLGEG
jgi:transcriptional regulator with XRE-family HTH domain